MKCDVVTLENKKSAGGVDLSDAVFIIERLFVVQEPIVCSDSADATDDGVVDVSDVVKITAFLTDLDRYDEYKAARAEAFLDRIPASSTVHSSQLLIPGMMVEVEAVAVLTVPRSSAPA